MLRPLIRLTAVALLGAYGQMQRQQLQPAVAVAAEFQLTYSLLQLPGRMRVLALLLRGERRRQLLQRLLLLAHKASMGRLGARRSSWLQALLAAGAAVGCQRALRQLPPTVQLLRLRCTMHPLLLRLLLELLELVLVLASTSAPFLVCLFPLPEFAAEGGHWLA